MRSACLRSALLALTLWPLTAGAVCDKLEFAELESMTREQLLTMRCQYRDEMMRVMDRPSTMARCFDEQKRMDRILARKYAIPGDGEALMESVSALCLQTRPK